MDKYNIKIIGDKVYVVKGVLFYTGNIVDFKTAREGIIEIIVEEVEGLESQIKVSPEEVFDNIAEALDLQIERCKKEMIRLQSNKELVEKYLITAENRRNKVR